MAVLRNFKAEIEALVCGIATSNDMGAAIPKPSQGMIREPVQIAERKALTPKERLTVLLASEGRCVLCGGKISGSFDVDHRVSLALGGLDNASNWQAAHPECHRLKTAGRDIPQIAKAKRQHKKSFGERPPGKIQCRGFDRSRRRKMDGTVERVKL